VYSTVPDTAFTDKLGRICLDILKGELFFLLCRREECGIARVIAASCALSQQLIERAPSTAFHSSNADNLADKWSPALQIRTVLLSIQALLSSPNPDDPLAADVSIAPVPLISRHRANLLLNSQVAKHYKENLAAAQAVSKEWTKKYAPDEPAVVEAEA